MKMKVAGKALSQERMGPVGDHTETFTNNGLGITEYFPCAHGEQTQSKTTPGKTCS